MREVLIENRELNRKMRRQLRKVGERIIIKAYKKHKHGKLNIITAPTGLGKTFAIQNKLLKSDKEAGKNRFLFLTVFSDAVDQVYKELVIICRDLRIDVYTSIKEFTDDAGDLEYPRILVTTLANAVNGGDKDPNRDPDSDELGSNGQTLLEYFKDRDFAVYWDEAHFGGSSSNETVAENTGNGEQPQYHASYYRFCKFLAQWERGKVTGFTATPIRQQEGKIDLDDKEDDMYHLLNNADDWPDMAECSEYSSQCNILQQYKANSVNDFLHGVRQGVDHFINFKLRLEELKEQIWKVEPTIMLIPKPVILLNSGMDYVDKSAGKKVKSITEDEQIEECIKVLNEYNIFDPDKHIFGKTSQDGNFVRSINDPNWVSVQGNENKFIEKVENYDDPLTFIFHKEKLKFGINIDNITHEIHSRVRAQQSAKFKITVSIRQLFGRAVRTYFGLHGDMFEDKKIPNYTSDVVDLLQKYKNSPIYENFREYLMLCNSHSFFVPYGKTYNLAVKEWLDNKKPYAIHISDSQFSIDSETGILNGISEKLTSSIAGKIRDLEYKKHKEIHPYCQRHALDDKDYTLKENDELCKAQQRSTFVDDGIYSAEDFDEYWFNHLEVNHKDGDRNNNEKGNLETLCSTCHAIITQGEGHYNNTYENSRISS